jgi:hypothetical protein
MRKFASIFSGWCAFTALICFWSNIAPARMIEQTYEQFAALLQRDLGKVGQTRRLSLEDQRIAERAAAFWVYLGPCKGDSRKLTDTESVAAIRWVMIPDLSLELDAAMLLMIALMTRDDLGRSSEKTCRFALEKIQAR